MLAIQRRSSTKQHKYSHQALHAENSFNERVTAKHARINMVPFYCALNALFKNVAKILTMHHDVSWQNTERVNNALKWVLSRVHISSIWWQVKSRSGPQELGTGQGIFEAKAFLRGRLSSGLTSGDKLLRLSKTLIAKTATPYLPEILVSLNGYSFKILY